MTVIETWIFKVTGNPSFDSLISNNSAFNMKMFKEVYKLWLRLESHRQIPNFKY